MLSVFLHVWFLSSLISPSNSAAVCDYEDDTNSTYVCVCDYYQACARETIQCPSNVTTACRVECVHAGACYDATIQWPAEPGKGILICEGTRQACRSVNFPTPRPDQDLFIECDAESECAHASIYCPEYANCHITCSAFRSCADATIYWSSNNVQSTLVCAFDNLEAECARTNLPPTTSPTLEPTPDPTSAPTASSSPTIFTSDPTQSPTNNPTIPTVSPTDHPSVSTVDPTLAPSKPPTVPPTIYPTIGPTVPPSLHPTLPPTITPTLYPTSQPTTYPTERTVDPSVNPSSNPTNDPSASPTMNPSNPPTVHPSNQPTVNPSNPPTANPSNEPTNSPSNPPTVPPTLYPSSDPTIDPTQLPSNTPSTFPTTNSPTANPTFGTHEAETVNTYTIVAIVAACIATFCIALCFVFVCFMIKNNHIIIVMNKEINESPGMTNDDDGRKVTLGLEVTNEFANANISPLAQPGGDAVAHEVDEDDTKEGERDRNDSEGVMMTGVDGLDEYKTVSPWTPTESTNAGTTTTGVTTPRGIQLMDVASYSLQNSPEAAKKGEKNVLEVQEWIENVLKLPQYFDVMVENGYDSMQIIKDISNEDELTEIGIMSKEHQTKILKEIEKLKRMSLNLAEDEFIISSDENECKTPRCDRSTQ